MKTLRLLILWIAAVFALSASAGPFTNGGGFGGGGGSVVSYPLLAPDGALGTSSYSFASETNTGLYRAGAADIRFGVGAADIWRIVASNFDISSTSCFGWGSSGVTTPDTFLCRDAQNVVAIKQAAVASTLRIYGTTTGPKYLTLSHDGTNAQIDTFTSSGFIQIGGISATKVIIRGTGTNDSAAAGMVGELVKVTIATGNSVALGTGVTATITAMPLSAGDWDCSGAVDYTFGAATSITNLTGGISLSGALGAQDTGFDFETPAAVPSAAATATWVTPVVQVSQAVSATVFLVSQATFTVSTVNTYGTIRCRRMR
jgi:hypothetical protein